MGIGEGSTAREVQGSEGNNQVGEGQRQPHQQHQNIVGNNTTAFHISRPSLPISTMISPPPLHLDDNSYHHAVSRVMLQNDHFQVLPSFIHFSIMSPHISNYFIPFPPIFYPFLINILLKLFFTH